MKKTILLCSIIWASIHVFAQDYIFIGIHGVKESGVSYWCQNMTWEKQALGSAAEYNVLKADFYGRKYDWPGTYLLTPKQAAVVYEVTINDPSFNCKHKTIGVIQGITLEDAEAKLQQQVAEKPKMYADKPEILLRWNPKGLPEVFKDSIAGLNVSILKSQASGGATLFKIELHNPTRLKAIAGITDKNGNILKGPFEIAPGGGLNNIVINTAGEIDFYAIYAEPDQQENKSLTAKLLNWIKGKINNPPTGGKSGKYEPAAVGVRG